MEKMIGQSQSDDVIAQIKKEAQALLQRIGCEGECLFYMYITLEPRRKKSMILHVDFSEEIWSYLYGDKVKNFMIEAMKLQQKLNVMWIFGETIIRFSVNPE